MSSTIELDPIEWDFRKVAAKNELHLDLLVEYEYARQNPMFCKAVSAWKKTRVCVEPRVETSEKCSDEEVQTLLEKGFGTLPERTREEILKGFPPWTFMDWLVHFPAFPKAFAMADMGWRPPLNPFEPLTIERYGRELSPWAFGERVQVLIPWDLYSPGELVAGFEKFVAANAPSESNEKESRGRPTTPINRLKWLSALRLSRTEGGTFLRMRDFLREYRKKKPVNDFGDLLPIYEKKDKWDEAIEKAEDYVKLLSP